MQEPIRVKSAELWQPPLQDIADALQEGLSANYQNVSVTVEQCPDLRDWGCTTAGMSGNARILDVGGEAYAHNKKYRDNQFDIPAMAEACGLPGAGIFGAGMASPAVLRGHCGELMASLKLGGQNRSRAARVGTDKQCIVEDYDFLVHCGLSNLYLSDGDAGPAVRVEVSTRTGEEYSLTQAMRNSLIDNLDVGGAKQIALGGVFKITGGRVKTHVSPDYNCIPFEYFDEEKNVAFRDFLQFYEMGPNLICFSVLWTGDPTGSGLYLRPSGEHAHFYRIDGISEAGHYHGDVTPEEISYSGYFHPAAEVYRINDFESRPND